MTPTAGPRARPLPAALGIDKLHKRVLVQTVAEALEGAVHRQDPVALESAPGLAYTAVFVTASATFTKSL